MFDCSKAHVIIVFKNRSELEEFYKGNLAFNFIMDRLEPFEKVEKYFYETYGKQLRNLSKNELEYKIFRYVLGHYFINRDDDWGAFYRVSRRPHGIKELEDGRIIVGVYASGD